MKVIEPSCSIVLQPESTVGKLEHIERIGRICYKSESKMADGTAEKFIANAITRGHESILEHANLIVETNVGGYRSIELIVRHASHRFNFRSFLRFTDTNAYLISGNARAWRDLFKVVGDHPGEIALPSGIKCLVEDNPVLFGEWMDRDEMYFKVPYMFRQIRQSDLLTSGEKAAHSVATFIFVCDRGVSHELVRHRVMSFTQESTRYCNYSKGQFGGEITVIRPFFFDTGIGNASNSLVYEEWKRSCERAERAYMKLLEYGATPQQARTVLPNSLKTEIVMTGNYREWRHFFELRACDKTGPAHPQMKQVAIRALEAAKWLDPGIFGDLEPAPL